jgi:hypothetical protein
VWLALAWSAEMRTCFAVLMVVVDGDGDAAAGVVHSQQTTSAQVYQERESLHSSSTLTLLADVDVVGGLNKTRRIYIPVLQLCISSDTQRRSTC